MNTPSFLPTRSTSLLIPSGFLIFCCAVFAGFIIKHPLDWKPPETLRIQYLALQDGNNAGSLDARLGLNDFIRKPLALNAIGGDYEVRPLAWMINGICQKLYQRLYPVFGPFLDEPFNIVLTAVTGFLLILVIREWFSSWSAALISAGFWLVTAQTMLDSRYAIRPTMALAGAFSLWAVYELLRLGRREMSAAGAFVRLTGALWLAFTSQEFTFCLVPALALLVIMERKLYRGAWIKLAVAAAAALGLYLLLRWVGLPLAMEKFIGEHPRSFRVSTAISFWELCNPGFIAGRFIEYVPRAFLYLVRENLGWGFHGAYPLRGLFLVPAYIAAIFCLSPAWKTMKTPLLVAGLFHLLVSLVMFPYVPASVEFPVYYYALSVLLFILPLGAAIAGVPKSRIGMKRIGLCLALGIIGLANFRTGSNVMEEMPGAFGFTPKMRCYVRDILSLEDYLATGGVPTPVYTSYPRPRRFDVSTKWDIMLDVWHGQADWVFALMMPLMHLQAYQDRRLLGDSREFAALKNISAGDDGKPVPALADMVQRGWYDLRRIRETRIMTGPDLAWQSDGEIIKAGKEETMIGNAYRAVLPAGRWQASWVVPGKTSPAGFVLLLTMADLQAAGSDEVYFRASPLPTGSCRISLRGPSGQVNLIHAYGWSYQVHLIPLSKLGDGGKVVVRVETDGETVVTGPVLLSAEPSLNPWPECRPR